MDNETPSVVYVVEYAVDHLAKWGDIRWGQLAMFQSVASAQNRLDQDAHSLWQQWTYDFPRCEIKLKYNTTGEAQVLINGEVCARFRVSEQYVRP